MMHKLQLAQVMAYLALCVCVNLVFTKGYPLKYSFKSITALYQYLFLVHCACAHACTQSDNAKPQCIYSIWGLATMNLLLLWVFLE